MNQLTGSRSQDVRESSVYAQKQKWRNYQASNERFATRFVGKASNKNVKKFAPFFALVIH
jgi:hypothetical protein